MLRVAVLALALMAASAVDSSKLVEKKKKGDTNCLWGLICWESEDDYSQRVDETDEEQRKLAKVKYEVQKIQAEKDKSEAREKENEKKKKEEKEKNRKYCGCNFACGADDGSKCFDASCQMTIG